MDFFSLMLLALSLSMDAFAVSISTGITLKQVRPWHAIKTGLFFGGFQALMPLIGYLAGNTVAAYIVNVDHWIAFILLGFIGVRMIIEAVKESEECPKGADPTRTRNLLVLAVATNDGLAGAAPNLGALLGRKNVYFVPFGQDDCQGKPASLVADFSRVPDAVDAALRGEQLQPVLLGAKGV